jgi:excinuclease ABC subunit C
MTQEQFRTISLSIPAEPGIYKYYDNEGTLLYVGKAKNLKKRVSSYFLKNQASYKTTELVRRIHKIDFTIVASEQDALFLENALIKQFQPIFNIDLKDDKTYPFIVIKNEPYPRVFLTRRKLKDGSQYLGPFTSVGRVRELIDIVRQNLPIRNCKLNLSEQNIRKQKYKVCLEYHLGNCKGPCEGLQTEEDYNHNLDQVKNILNGNLALVIQHLQQEMNREVAQLQFEKAAILKKKIEYLETYRSRSGVVNPKLGNLDVFSIRRYKDKAFLNYLMVQNGTIIQTENLEVNCKLDESETEVLEFMIGHVRNLFNSKSTELIVPFPVELLKHNFLVTIPKAGPKKKLLELSEKNVTHALNDYKRKEALHLTESNKQPPIAVLKELQDALHLRELPVHVECFDNSNFHGSFPVAAMVCFKNGIPSKKDYRHYNIKTVSGINDFDSMKEVVYRRYKRLLEEQAPLPQLVIIDGGKGQLSAAAESIKQLNLQGHLTLVGLAKNVEEIFFQGDKESLRLPYQSEVLRLIRSIRDEVHRFGITFHRQKRSKGTFQNQLEQIPGIGAVTQQALLKKFRSVANIKQASVEEISLVTGRKKALVIKETLEKEAK